MVIDLQASWNSFIYSAPIKYYGAPTGRTRLLSEDCKCGEVKAGLGKKHGGTGEAEDLDRSPYI